MNWILTGSLWAWCCGQCHRLAPAWTCSTTLPSKSLFAPFFSQLCALPLSQGFCPTSQPSGDESWREKLGRGGGGGVDWNSQLFPKGWGFAEAAGVSGTSVVQHSWKQ